jgi:hypothetical protein
MYQADGKRPFGENTLDITGGKTYQRRKSPTSGFPR